MPNPAAPGDRLDGPADVADPAAGADGGDAGPQRLLGGRRRARRCGARRRRRPPTRKVREQSPCMPVEVDGDVAVDDVAGLERAVVGDAVGHDLVDRGAEALGVAPVAERRRVAALVEVGLVGDGVEVVGGDAGRDLGGEAVEHPAGGPAGGGEAGRCRRGSTSGRRARLLGTPPVATYGGGPRHRRARAAPPDTRPRRTGRSGGAAWTGGGARPSVFAPDRAGPGTVPVTSHVVLMVTSAGNDRSANPPRSPPAK